jgi:hypothetical protein
MKFNTLFPSKYLQASDFEDTPRTMKIESVTLEKMQDGTAKPLVSFEGADKGLILNRTNGSVLVELYGGDTNDWVGESVTLFAAVTDFQGKRVPCIRLRAPQKAGKKAAASDPLASLDDLQDEIPFAWIGALIVPWLAMLSLGPVI